MSSTYKSWPFVEAEKILSRIEGKTPTKGYVLFETGYGPSGLPHLGTFGEVLRTTMVRRALAVLAPEIPSQLVAFSDDLDGFRKVPTNVPNQDLLAAHLHKPLTSVPDPFGTHDSFGAHNNARLQGFLDAYSFDYTFKSSTACYQSGVFDATLLKVLEQYDAIMAVMLPTLGKERQDTYSPFLPICPRTGKVLQVPLLSRDTAKGTVRYQDPETGQTVETPVTGGHCKLQWKVDWAMRWVALGVDYEMCGKDLIDSYKLSSKIALILGGMPPVNLTYELFLDERGEKISKSKGNGISMEEWLRYAPAQSLAYYLYQNPTRAKRLFFDVIPKATDEYLTFLQKFPSQTLDEQKDNPVFHLHGETPPAWNGGLSFSLLLNLAAACNAEDASVLWGFISRYDPAATPTTAPMLNELVGFAVRYYHDFVRPAKQYRAATAQEKSAFADLAARLRGANAVDAESLQTLVYDVGMAHNYANLRDWFSALYEILLGQPTGPRMGSFIALFGVEPFLALMDERLT